MAMLALSAVSTGPTQAGPGGSLSDDTGSCASPRPVFGQATLGIAFTSVPLKVTSATIANGTWQSQYNCIDPEPVVGSVVQANEAISGSIWGAGPIPGDEDPGASTQTPVGRVTVGTDDGSVEFIFGWPTLGEKAYFHAISQGDLASRITLGSPMNTWSLMNGATASVWAPSASVGPESRGGGSKARPVRLTWMNRSGRAAIVSSATTGNFVDWRGATPARGMRVRNGVVWTYVSDTAAADAGILVSIRVGRSASFTVASSIRGDGRRSTDVIAADGVRVQVHRDRGRHTIVIR